MDSVGRINRVDNWLGFLWVVFFVFSGCVVSQAEVPGKWILELMWMAYALLGLVFVAAYWRGKKA